MVKNLPAKQETWVHSLDWGYSLKKVRATHSSILAWEIPWTEGWAVTGQASDHGVGTEESDMT